MLNGLDLFSGIGGMSLGISRWVRTVCYVENDPYAQSVLLSRQATGQLHVAPIWDDVRTLDRIRLHADVDIIFGGFPCQDISVAGNGTGLDGKRSGLFFEVVRLASELQPAFLFLENVPAIRTRGGERVVKELASVGYDCRWCTVSAAQIGAPHKRERWFLLARRSDTHGMREPQQEGSVGDVGRRLSDVGTDVPDTKRNELRVESGRGRGSNREGPPIPGDNGPALSVANSMLVTKPEPGHQAETIGSEWDSRLESSRCSPRFPESVACKEVANSPVNRCREEPADARRHPEGNPTEGLAPRLNISSPSVADSDRARLAGRSGVGSDDVAGLEAAERDGNGVGVGHQFEAPDWSVEPDVGRVVAGVPNRVDRLRCLGNTNPPAQYKAAFEILLFGRRLDDAA